MVGVLAWVWIGSAAAAQPQEREDELELTRLRAELALPGPETHQTRAAAVAALLSSPMAEAHQTLQELLVAPSDPDGTASLVLEQLVQRLNNPRDPVLGEAAKSEVTARRAAYVGALAQLCGGGIAMPNGRARLARDCLLALASRERLAAFGALLASGDSAHRCVAARAAATCQDLTLARVLGDHFDDPDLEVRQAIRDALAHLTFRRQGFADKAEFDAWFVERTEQRIRFVDLAEEAAVRAAADAAKQLAGAEAAVASLVLELVDSWVQQQDTPWKKLHDRVLDTGSPELTRQCLQRLRTTLARLDSLSGQAADRLAFVEALSSRLGDELTPGDRALLLEVCAYLVVPADERAQTAVIERLVAALAPQHDPVVRAAAVAGLRRHPSDSTTRAVVAAAAQATAGGDAEFLRAALATLRAKGWSAPSEESARQAWCRLLSGIVRLTTLPPELRRDALATLDLRDADHKRVPEAFNVLFGVASDSTSESALREQALLQIRPLVQADNIARYAELLAACLQDATIEVRARTAQLITDLPHAPSSQIETLRHSIRTSLVDEADLGVHALLVDSLRQLDRVEAYQVPELLVSALERLASRPADADVTFRRRTLGESLRVLASQAGRPADVWIRAAEALLKIEDATGAAAVLARHESVKPTLDGANLRRVRLLRIGIALLAGSSAWSDPARAAEAGDVLDAIGELERAKALPDDPRIGLLQIQILAGLGRHDRALELGRQFANPRSDQALRHALQVQMARSHVAQGGAQAALDALAGLPRDPEVLSALDLIGALFVDQKQFALAVPVWAEAVQETPEGAPELPVRILRWAEARHQLDPKDPALRDLLQARARIFAATGVPAGLRQSYETLLNRVGATAAGG